ncbi:hypothetical protein [Cryptosporangium aurantiacum]|uniref:Uncharacterized protein n=1 Tax=Cryptosporangium aurantiacum TaxID=134849 RepID=A0A1M7RHD7_9ACTN|nr:hypothetical protein [Cryptosporangium aurantiacum]SHN45725.1 hypothetical protein SAMN05443668_112228 [Cryptosporangium aurantiacum]
MSTPTGPGSSSTGPAELGPGQDSGTDAKQWPEPLYAVAGVGDLLAEQLRRLVANAPEISAQFQRNAATLPDDLRSLPRELRTLAADLPSYAAGLQSRARDLDSEAVKRNVSTAQNRAQDIYRGLVERGEQAVKQPS